MNFAEQRLDWLAKSRALPELKSRIVSSNRVVIPVADKTAWQDTAFLEDSTPLDEKKLSSGDSVFVDSGEHLVGHLRLTVTMPDRACDAPVRLRLRFAELPHEAAFPDFDLYHGGLCRSWLQDEIINIDNPPETIELPRRYAFRYLKIEVLAAVAPVVFTQIECRAVTSAAIDVAPVSGEFVGIDKVGLRTLRNCMQNVFEDGPKRDRRLWLGDLRLQALVNAVTYRNFSLVERSLYLLGSCLRDDGLFPAAVFDRPVPQMGSIILDYALLLPVVLLEHLKFSGNEDFCREFLPVAAHQMSFMRKNFNEDGVFVDPGNIWIFIDWSPALDRSTAITAVYIFALNQLAELSERLGISSEDWRNEARMRAEALRRNCFDDETGLMVSGGKRQVSWASNAWSVLAGVLTKEEGRAALKYLAEHPECERPKTPYLWHYAVEACEACGADELALRIIRDYWGGMVKRGADTFWEAYVPEEPFFSPYNDPLVNSACHAWSCTPSYFFRRKSLPAVW